MTLTVATQPKSRRPVRAGWRPTDQRPFPSLGWSVLDWAYAFLPLPNDERNPFVYTNEQARFIVRWYELDPITGEFVNRRSIIEMAKGWGKSPLAATLALTDFAGPVCFDGWDANGQPVGVPWGTGERPAPWVQLAAVSEDQTENTNGSLYALLTANDHRAARALGIDEGRTRLYLKNVPGSRLEPVTASAGSREGQRVTFAVLDETHLWLPSNGGVKLSRTILRNAAKMNGRTLETTNAPVLGEKSVAERSDPRHPESGVLHMAHRPDVEPDPAWPKDKLLAALAKAYGDAWWVDKGRLLKEMADPTHPWDDSLRFWFNIRTAGMGRAVDPRRWDELALPQDVPMGTRIALGFDGSISTDSTFLRACTADGYSFIVRSWERPRGTNLRIWQAANPGKDWHVDRVDVKRTIAAVFARYDVGRMLADPPLWRTEIEEWATAYGEEVVLELDTNQARRFAPAVDRWLTAIREGSHTHDGDELTAEHVKATHLKKVHLTQSDSDGRTRYVLVRGDDNRRIDAAIADVLAFEAAMTMPEHSTTKRPGRLVTY
jgi:hypothetical protein